VGATDNTQSQVFKKDSPLGVGEIPRELISRSDRPLLGLGLLVDLADCGQLSFHFVQKGPALQ
jgi:hypothetical protein